MCLSTGSELTRFCHIVKLEVELMKKSNDDSKRIRFGNHKLHE